MRIQNPDFSVNVTPALLWQRNTAARLTSLINSKQAWYDLYQTQFWEDWVTNVFNLQTANDFGLSVWCIILQIPYFISSTTPSTAPTWGFNETPPINTFVNFNNGNFIPDYSPQYVLTTEEQRIALQFAFFRTYTRCAIPEINAFLFFIFGANGMWALDGLNMSMTYVINAPISDNLFNVLRDFDLFPRPAGVKLYFIETNNTLFGFNETPPINTFVNFNNGSFKPEF
jgi:hypothetical protein